MIENVAIGLEWNITVILYELCSLYASLITPMVSLQCYQNAGSTCFHAYSQTPQNASLYRLSLKPKLSDLSMPPLVPQCLILSNHPSDLLPNHPLYNSSEVKRIPE
jgi:hypothetical protein